MSPETLARGGPRPKPGTLNELFFTALERDLPDALRFKRDGSWIPISHHELGERVRHAARGLEALGARPGDRIALLSENRPEWAIADYACLTGRFVDVPVYPTLPADQVVHVLRDSGAIAIFVSTTAQARKIESIRGELPALRTVISFVPTGGHAEMTLVELEAHGCQGETEESIAAYRANALQARPDDLATIIYTAGTTGVPKGVMLSHDNLHSNVLGSAAVLPFVGEDSCLSLLPMSHSFERMAGHYMMFSLGIRIAYAESIEALRGNMLEVKPTLLLAVPRLYEKIAASVRDKAMTGGALKRRIFLWASAVGGEWADEVLAGRKPGRVLGIRYLLAHKLVFAKLHSAVGGRIRFFVSGAAPLNPEINKFFFSAGLPVLEGYGLTETSPVISVNAPGNIRIGTVGRPIDGVEVRIADDEEILTRGPNVMQGYYKKPDETRAAVTEDGWFHTGDLGKLEDGFLTITGRKKDIIVTAGGKNIAPAPIEHRMQSSKYVAQAVMLGDKRKFPIMLIVPNYDNLERWAREQGLTPTDPKALIAERRVQQLYEREMNTVLAGLARYETPKKVVLVEKDFSIEGGELTPKMSIRRNVVEEKNKAAIDALYAGPAPTERQ
ncbi:MAG: long-chain fatty acid--CoA ligase [Gemmatimonadaceae bacterium]|nr:long-chain fatty acid--CoA ligase [Gemmatimonadaceae bacterium]